MGKKCGYELCMNEVKRVETELKNHNKLHFKHQFYLDVLNKFEKDKTIINKMEKLINKLLDNSKNFWKLNDIIFFKENIMKVYKSLKTQGFESEDIKKLVNFLNKAIVHNKELYIIAS